MTEVVVVCADADPRLRQARAQGGWQVADDVVPRPLLADHVGVQCDCDVRHREPGRMRIRIVERRLCRLQRLGRVAECPEHRVCNSAADAGGGDAGAGQRGVERHRDDLAGVRRIRTGDDEDRLRAVLPRRHRLVAQVRVASEDRLGLRLRLLGKVAEDDHHLVFHIQCGVAVVREPLRIGHDDAVASKDDRGIPKVDVVGERERLHFSALVEALRQASAEPHPGSAILAAGRELERHGVAGLPRQRLRADALQFADDVGTGTLFTHRPGQPAFQLIGGQRGDVHFRARRDRDGSLRVERGGVCDETGDEQGAFHLGLFIVCSRCVAAHSSTPPSPSGDSTAPGRSARPRRRRVSRSTTAACRRVRRPAGCRSRWYR